MNSKIETIVVLLLCFLSGFICQIAFYAVMTETCPIRVSVNDFILTCFILPLGILGGPILFLSLYTNHIRSSELDY